MFIINTPFIFKTIWSFVNPMLEERTRKKIHVLGTVSAWLTEQRRKCIRASHNRRPLHGTTTSQAAALIVVSTCVVAARDS